MASNPEDAELSSCRDSQMGGEAQPAHRAAALGIAHLLSLHGWPLKVPVSNMSPLEIWKSSDKELIRLLDLPGPSAGKLLRFRQRFNAGEAFAELKEQGITMVVLGEPAYPFCLSWIHDPPLTLFIKGGLSRLEELLKRPRVAIVGARLASRYGIDAARLLSEGLSRAGVCVVSGMALGIDAAAHRGSLLAAGGAIAVLGCGVDVIYPRANRRLYGDILASGLVVSEYPPGSDPRSWRFPARNRIIAGLTQGVVVVEARRKSGALITADFSLEEGREVWAVPGSLFSDLSEGPHRLIRLGASAVTSAEDILEDLGIGPEIECRSAADLDLSDLSADERRVFEVLGLRPEHQDTIAERAALPGARAATALISLELNGLSRHEPGRGYCRG